MGSCTQPPAYHSMYPQTQVNIDEFTFLFMQTLLLLQDFIHLVHSINYKTSSFCKLPAVLRFEPGPYKIDRWLRYVPTPFQVLNNSLACVCGDRKCNGRFPGEYQFFARQQLCDVKFSQSVASPGRLTTKYDIGEQPMCRGQFCYQLNIFRFILQLIIVTVFDLFNLKFS